MTRSLRAALALATLIALLAGTRIDAPRPPITHAQAPDDLDNLPYAAPGPYAVGVQDALIPASAANDDRPDAPGRALAVSIWYPAQAAEDAAPVTYDLGMFTLTGIAHRDAAPNAGGGPYPLVVYSHGHAAFREHNAFLTEHLASYGFVVIAPDHPGNNLRDGAGGLDFGGEIVRSFALRPLDVLHVLDYATALDTDPGPFTGLIDHEHTAVVGYSFGGYTALAAGGARLDVDGFAAWCEDPAPLRFDPTADPVIAATDANGWTLTLLSCPLLPGADRLAQVRGLDAPPVGPWPATTDERIRAVIALAPWNMPVFGTAGLAALDIPALIMVGSADEVAHPARDAFRAYASIGSERKALAVFGGADHLLFNHPIDGLPDPARNWPGARAVMNHLATAFLLATVRDDDPAASATAAGMLAPAAVTVDRLDYAATFE